MVDLFLFLTPCSLLLAGITGIGNAICRILAKLGFVYCKVITKFSKAQILGSGFAGALLQSTLADHGAAGMALYQAHSPLKKGVAATGASAT